MQKFEIDFLQLEKKLNQPKYYKLSDVQHRLQKVAFDVVRFMDGQEIEGLWQIKKTDDGEVIVAMYEDSSNVKESTNWTAVTDKTAANVHLFYKGTPVKKLCIANMGIPQSDWKSAADLLPAKLASNQNLVGKLLNDLEPEHRENLLNTYPELRVK